MSSNLLDALLSSWDCHQTTLIGLLEVLPPKGLSARAMPTSPTVGAMFTHMHYERLVSVQENAPEWAGTVPETQWLDETDPQRLRVMLEESGQRVRQAVQARIEAGRPLEQDFPHPLQLLQFLVFHESYHHGQIKLALKAVGTPLDDEVVGPRTWDVWRAR